MDVMSSQRSLPSGEVEVLFTDEERQAIREQGVERNREMIAARRKFKYRATSAARHEVGLLGEYAVASWIRSLGGRVRLIGDDPQTQEDGHGDLLVLMDDLPDHASPLLVEVKTRRARGWAEYRHDIDMGQLNRLAVAAVVWCVVPDRIASGPVTIVGWSTPVELWRRWTHEAELAQGDDFRVDWLEDWPTRRLDGLVALLRRGEENYTGRQTPFD